MPKVIVLYAAGDSTAASIAAAAAEGANEIRFTEVDVRSVGGTDAQKALESASQLNGYDGVLLALSGSELPPDLAALLGELAAGAQLPNIVFGLTGTDANALRSAALVGGIIVSEPVGATAPERARKLGARMAKVIGWVRHALAHETEHHHHH
ncbi:MAG TPA: hypothetical protein VGM67_11965 [Gemmatimonadaceae bacterium]